MADTAQDEAADFAAVLAELHAEEAGASVDAAATPDDEGDDEPGDEADEAGEELDEDAEETEDPETLEPEAASAVKATLRGLLEAGKLKDLAKALDVDPSIFKTNPRQFAAMRKGLSDAATAKAAADAAATEGRTKLQQAEQLTTSAQTTYGPIVAARRAADAGDWSTAKAAVELIFPGRTFQEISASIARADKGLDPGQVEVIKLRRELAARDAAVEAAKATQTEAQTTAAHVAGVEGKLKGTPLEGVEGAAKDIVALVHASKIPGGGYSKTVQQAYAEVKAALAKKATQLARLAPKSAAAVAAKPAGASRVTQAERTKVAPAKVKLTPKQQEEVDFKAVLAEAKRDTEAQERKARRVKK